ncbi:hypothetical protein ACOMHN_004475 [Nucella lapillus]
MADPKAIFDDDCDTTLPARDLLESHPACLKCGQIQRMMKCCTKCHSAFYCSKTCFAQHWPVHKKTCQQHKPTPEPSQQQSNGDCGDCSKTRYRVIQRHKTTDVPLAVNFQKAADVLASKPTTDSAESPKLSTSSNLCTPAEEDRQPHHDPNKLPGVEITLRYNHQKHKFKVCDAWDGETILKKISTFLSCLPLTMRIIHKGRQLRADSVRSGACASAVWQVLGEAMEDASGLEAFDIEVVMKQMGAERNVAVRALKKCGGDLIDAMMELGNK